MTKRLIAKYGNSFMLPPPPEELLEEKIPLTPKAPKEPDLKKLNLPFHEEVLALKKQQQEESGEAQKLRDKAKQQHLKNLQDMLDQHMEEMSFERETKPPPSTVLSEEETHSYDEEAFKPTLTMAGRLFDFFQKYAGPDTKDVINPPPPMDLEDVEIPKNLPLPKNLEDAKLEEQEYGSFIYPRDQHLIEPRLKSLDMESEILKGRVLDELIRQRRRKRMEEELGREEEPKEEIDTVPAIPAAKKASKNDLLLRQCSKYYDICRKL